MEPGPHEAEDPEGGALLRSLLTKGRGAAHLPHDPQHRPETWGALAERVGGRSPLLLEDKKHICNQGAAELPPSLVPGRTPLISEELQPLIRLHQLGESTDLLAQAMLAAGLPAMSGGALVLPVPPHNVTFSRDIERPIVKMSLPDATLLDPTTIVQVSAENPKWGNVIEEEDSSWNEETSDGDEFYDEERGEEADDERISKDSDEEIPARESADLSVQVHDADDDGRGEEADDESSSDTMKAAGRGGLDEAAGSVEDGARPLEEVCGEGSCGCDEVGQAVAAIDFSVLDSPAEEFSSIAVNPSITPARPTTHDAPGTSRQVTEDEELKKVHEELWQDLHIRATLFQKIICDGLHTRHR